MGGVPMESTIAMSFDNGRNRARIRESFFEQFQNSPQHFGLSFCHCHVALISGLVLGELENPSNILMPYII